MKNLKILLSFLIVVVLVPFFVTKKIFGSTPMTVTMNIGETRLTVSGYTSPLSQVTVTENNVVIGTTVSDAVGYFTKTIVFSTAGVKEVGLQSTDISLNTSSRVLYSVSLIPFSEVLLSNIIIPPTINLDQSIVDEGDIIIASGTAVPLSTVTIFVFENSFSESTSTDSFGNWSIDVDTNDYSAGNYSIYAKTLVSGGYQSKNSTTREFRVKSVSSSSDDDGEDDNSSSTETSSGGEKENVFTRVFKKITNASHCLLPSFIRDYDYDHNCKFSFEEFKLSAVDWRSLWIGGKDLYCDVNQDNRCNLVDFSILLYNINYNEE